MYIFFRNIYFICTVFPLRHFHTTYVSRSKMENVAGIQIFTAAQLFCYLYMTVSFLTPPQVTIFFTIFGSISPVIFSIQVINRMYSFKHSLARMGDRVFCNRRENSCEIKSAGNTLDTVWSHWPPDSVGDPHYCFCVSLVFWLTETRVTWGRGDQTWWLPPLVWLLGKHVGGISLMEAGGPSPPWVVSSLGKWCLVV